MFASFHKKMSLRKLVCATSYAWLSLLLIFAISEGSPVIKSIVFSGVSLGAFKALDLM